MHPMFVRLAFGWLALGGGMHFAVDVAPRYFRGTRAPGPETSLYYGPNTALALGQALFGLPGLLVAHHAMAIST
ncbi:MAG: hypothetical protein ACREO7_03970 [Pseudoxanthomonas sp.]